MNLSVSTLFFELALIFLPGFIWMKIHAKYGAKGDTTQFDMILNAFIFGVISYAILVGIYSLFGKQLNILNIDSDTKKLLEPKIFPEIFYAICISIACGVLYLYIENYKIFTRFVQKIRATKTFGDEDVWDYTFNSPIPAVEYINLRDFDKNIVYCGWVMSFSETEKLRELVLRDVEVFDFDGQFLFEMPMIYLARAPENIHIEFPYGAKPSPDVEKEKS